MSQPIRRTRSRRAPAHSPFLPSNEPLCMRIPLTVTHYLEIRCLYPPISQTVMAPAPVPHTQTAFRSCGRRISPANRCNPLARPQVRAIAQSGVFTLFRTVEEPRHFVIRAMDPSAPSTPPSPETRCQFDIAIVGFPQAVKMVVYYPTRAQLYVVVKTRIGHQLTQVFTVSPFQRHSDHTPSESVRIPTSQSDDNNNNE